MRGFTHIATAATRIDRHGVDRRVGRMFFLNTDLIEATPEIVEAIKDSSRRSLAKPTPTAGA
jgi:hypothetical protein